MSFAKPSQRREMNSTKRLNKVKKRSKNCSTCRKNVEGLASMGYTRKDDIVLTELNQQVKDFLDRYERDLKDTQSWRTHYNETITAHGKILSDLEPLKDYMEFLQELRPNYRRVVVLLAGVITVSVGFAVKAFWQHVGWR
jgi:hypothetical protein